MKIALLSVYNKEGIADFARELVGWNAKNRPCVRRSLSPRESYGRGFFGH